MIVPSTSRSAVRHNYQRRVRRGVGQSAYHAINMQSAGEGHDVWAIAEYGAAVNVFGRNCPDGIGDVPLIFPAGYCAGVYHPGVPNIQLQGPPTAYTVSPTATPAEVAASIAASTPAVNLQPGTPANMQQTFNPVTQQWSAPAGGIVPAATPPQTSGGAPAGGTGTGAGFTMPDLSGVPSWVWWAAGGLAAFMVLKKG